MKLLGCKTCFRNYGMDMPVTIVCLLEHHDLLWGEEE